MRVITAVANVGTKVNWIWLLIALAIAIFGLGALLRNYVQNSWGELRLSLIFAKERLAIAEAADLEKVDDPEFLRKCIEFDKNKIREIEERMRKIENKWKLFFRGRVITCFDSAILEQELAYHKTLADIKQKSATKEN